MRTHVMKQFIAVGPSDDQISREIRMYYMDIMNTTSKDTQSSVPQLWSPPSDMGGSDLFRQLKEGTGSGFWVSVMFKSLDS